MPNASNVYALALSQLGYHEGRDPNGNWNNNNKYAAAVGVSNRESWCMTFQSWLLLETKLQALGPQHCDYTGTALNWFKARKRLSFFPALGAQCYMGPNGLSHVGFVYAYDADWIYTIEGNTNTNGSAQGDGVYKQKRARRGTTGEFPYAYGVPAYAGGTVGADPAHPIAGMRHAATGHLSVPPKPSPPPSAPHPYVAFPGEAFFKGTPKSPVITAMGKRLVAEHCGKYTNGPGPQWTDADRQSYAAWQRKLGYTGSAADGWPGKSSWDKLKVPK